MLTKTSNGRSARSAFTASCCALFRVIARLVPFPIPQTTLGRRRLTAGYVAAALLIPISSWATGSVLPLIVLAPVVAVLVIALGLSVDLITDRPTSSLDERERRIRDSTLDRPLEIGIGLGVVIGFLVRWTIGNDDPLPVALLMTTATLAFTLRLIAIAWNLPDSVGEE